MASMLKLSLALAALLIAVPALAAPAFADEAAPAPAACPSSLPDAKCYQGQDENGAWYWIAIPANWNHELIVHAHGGPSIKPPQPDTSKADLDRFSVMVRQGYAWIGSSYRRGGYGVRMAAADTDHARALFWRVFGKPQRTILHGQSWGGNVAAKTEELYALDVDGGKNYDGVLLTSGVLGGGTRAYQFRADLRAVYQYYCHNMPRPDEAQYPLWQGLPLHSTLTQKELHQRIDACTGIDEKPEQRTPQQTENLKNILAVTGIRESHLVHHMAWASFLFRDLVQKRLDGLNPFDNSQTVYHGSDDDKALNAGVTRFKADPRAVAKLAYDADLSGLIVLPTLTIHAINDPTASFNMEAQYAEVVAHAGRSDLLVQTATDERVHEHLSDAEYIALLNTLENWITTNRQPDQARIAADCQTLRIAGGCHFQTPVAAGANRRGASDAGM
jgi:hypothetical protein